MNVALYGPRASRWAMTERSDRALWRDARTLAIGPSAVTWDGTCLEIAINEIAVPLPARLTGRIRLRPEALNLTSFALDPAGRHRWHPMAPSARVEVAFEKPSLAWSGEGYLDANAGARPLERDFVAWDWSRTALTRGAAIHYDVTRRDGTAHALALRIDRQAHIEELAPLSSARLPGTLWRMPRKTRADTGAAPQVVRTLEDAPFYARSQLATTVLGERAPAIHESLSLDRFAMPIVQMMLPFRMPRRA